MLSSSVHHLSATMGGVDSGNTPLRPGPANPFLCVDYFLLRVMKPIVHRAVPTES
jgi:hypothetical protein